MTSAKHRLAILRILSNLFSSKVLKRKCALGVQRLQATYFFYNLDKGRSQSSSDCWQVMWRVSSFYGVKPNVTKPGICC